MVNCVFVIIDTEEILIGPKGNYGSNMKTRVWI